MCINYNILPPTNYVDISVDLLKFKEFLNESNEAELDWIDNTHKITSVSYSGHTHAFNKYGLLGLFDLTNFKFKYKVEYRGHYSRKTNSWCFNN